MLSLQLHPQPFLSAGEYGGFKTVADPRAASFAHRYRLLADAMTCADGKRMVLHWEYRPGSVLFVAWQHGRSQLLSSGAFRGNDDLFDLFDPDSDDTL